MQAIPFPKTSGTWIIVRNLRLIEGAGKSGRGLSHAVYDYWQAAGGWAQGGSISKKFTDRDAAAKFIRDHGAELASAT